MSSHRSTDATREVARSSTAVEAPRAEPRRSLTLDLVGRIVAIDDAALRNLWITESYADLAARLLAVYGADQTWCSFATWASNTAGLSIRGQELPNVVAELFPDAHPHLSDAVSAANDATMPLRHLRLAKPLEHSGLEQLVATAVGQVSGFIAHGNTLVYAELAPLFVRFVEWLESDVERDRGGASDVGEIDVEPVLAAVGVPAAHDEPLVHQAFRSYALAAFAADRSERAQLILTGNIAAVLHEQQRLQPDIAGALDAGLLDVGADLGQLTHRLLPAQIRRVVTGRIDRAMAPHLERLWEHVATRLLMTLAVPGETLHLGRDLPPLADGRFFPDVLRRIRLGDLRRLLATWDRTDGTAIGTAARDWADLAQRMNYIVNLFRSRQRSLQLTASPFTADEYRAMCAGLDSAAT